jgi:hypothetical protein
MVKYDSASSDCTAKADGWLNTSTTATPSWRTEYSIKDHLGNARISFTDKNLNGIIDVTTNSSTNEIFQVTERSQRVKYDSASSEETAKAGGWAYYAFGMTYDGPWQINDAAKDNPYQYNGKELNLDHGLNLVRLWGTMV